MKTDHWHVRPAEVSQWTIEAPDGTVTEMVTGGLAIEIGTKWAREGQGCAIVYGRDGKILCGEDFSGSSPMLWDVH